MESQKEKTEWIDVYHAALSETDAVGESQRDKINSALDKILRRFEKPISSYFRQRLLSFMGDRRNVDDDAKDMFGDFVLYLLQNRKVIFRRYNRDISKLRTFLHVVSKYFANNYIARLSRRELSHTDLVEIVADSDYDGARYFEVEYCNRVCEFALSRLKKHHQDEYYLLKSKYFPKTEDGNAKLKKMPSSIELAVLEGVITEDEKLRFEEGKRRIKEEIFTEQEKVEFSEFEKDILKKKNLLDRRLSDARQRFSALLREEILKTLDSSEEDAATLLAEELEVFKRYILWISFEMDSVSK